MDLPTRPTSEAVEPPDAAQRSRIGVDEWVASADDRFEHRTGLGALLGRRWFATPP